MERISHVNFYPDYYDGESEDDTKDDDDRFNSSYLNLSKKKKTIHISTIYKQMKNYVPTKFFNLVTRKVMRDIDYSNV